MRHSPLIAASAFPQRPRLEDAINTHKSSHVIGPLGTILTPADLPSTNAKRWTVYRKAEIVAAVGGGLLSLEEACARYSLTPEEFISWQPSYQERLRSSSTRSLPGATKKGQVNRRFVHKPSHVTLEAISTERRGRPTETVLSNAVIADTNGENALDCLILDLSALGAAIQSSTMFKHDAELYLVDTHNEMAHSATVVWVDGDRIGLTFIRSYSVPINLPRRLGFLRKVLLDAKLRQVRGGAPLSSSPVVTGSPRGTAAG